jgi:hypothetical protein
MLNAGVNELLVIVDKQHGREVVLLARKEAQSPQSSFASSEPAYSFRIFYRIGTWKHEVHIDSM